MHEVVQFLTENPIVYFATCDKHHHPRVRPFQFLLEKEGKLYFCTSCKKDVYREVRYNPTIELSTTAPDSTWIRVSGRVTFDPDAALKERILQENPQIQKIYGSAENPDLVPFFISDVKAVLSDFSGDPPRTYTL